MFRDRFKAYNTNLMYYPLFFQKSIQATDLHVSNHLFSDTGYYLHYLKMRLKQYEMYYKS